MKMLSAHPWLERRSTVLVNRESLLILGSSRRIVVENTIQNIFPARKRRLLILVSFRKGLFLLIKTSQNRVIKRYRASMSAAPVPEYSN